MLVSLQNDRGSSLFFIALLIMLVSLFVSRAALSISVILFLLASLIHGDPLAQVRNYFQTPLLWIIGSLFFVPLVSGLWSEDEAEWIRIIRIKLPLLVLPFAFASPVSLSKKQWEIIALLSIALVTIATVGSLLSYIMEARLVNESYLEGKSLQTAFDNDRVRFSWVVGLTSLGAGWAGISYWPKQGGRAIIFFFIAAWLAVYLHILAVRTGLVVFYLSLFFVFIYGCRAKAGKSRIILIIIFALPVLAWFTFPSFQNRVKYLAYEFEFAKDRSYLPRSTDPVRIISMQAGIEQFRSAPVLGLGFGDIRSSSKKWYAEYHPSMREDDMILPSSEYLVYAAGAGTPGNLCILAADNLPLFVKLRHRKPWLLLNIAVFLSFFTDIGLEVQYGVFIYCFAVLAGWKWMVSENG